MEHVINILCGFILLSFLLRTGFYPFYLRLAAALCCAVFVWWIVPWATEQSSADLKMFFSSPERLRDAAVWIVLDSCCLVAFCFLPELKTPAEYFRSSGGRGKGLRCRRITDAFFRYYPGILFPAVAGYALIRTIFAFPGVDFARLAGITAIGVLLLVPAGAWLLRKLFPEPGFRKELLFITVLFVVLLGITATVNGQPYYRSVSGMDRAALIGTAGVFAAGLLLGFLWKMIKKN